MFIGSTTYNFNNKSKDSPNAISVDNTFSYVNSHGVTKTRTFTAQLTAASLKAQHYVKKVCTTPNIPPSTSKFQKNFSEYQNLTLTFFL